MGGKKVTVRTGITGGGGGGGGGRERGKTEI